MKHTLNTVSAQEAKGRFRLFTLLLLLLTFCFLTGFGCEEPFKGSRPPAGRTPGAVSLDEFLPAANRIIREGLAAQDAYIRVNAIEVVATTRQIRLMPKVQRLLENDFVSPVRFAAALAVGDTQYRLGEKFIEPLLNDPDQNIRIAAAYALSKLTSFDSFDYLRKAIDSEDQTVRANAALLMGKSRDKRAQLYLYLVLRSKDSSDKVIFQAAESIAMLGDERIYQRLWTLLISAYADDRVMGIRAMGALGSTQAKDALITMLDDDVLNVRLAAAQQLGMLGDKTGEPEVLDVFRKNLTAGMRPEELEHVYVLTALAIGQIRTEALSRYLPQLLRNHSIFVRIAAAKAVFQYKMKD
jgi:HEAT repeat protein